MRLNLNYGVLVIFYLFITINSGALAFKNVNDTNLDQFKTTFKFKLVLNSNLKNLDVSKIINSNNASIFQKETRNLQFYLCKHEPLLFQEFNGLCSAVDKNHEKEPLSERANPWANEEEAKNLSNTHLEEAEKRRQEEAEKRRQEEAEKRRQTQKDWENCYNKKQDHQKEYRENYTKKQDNIPDSSRNELIKKIHNQNNFIIESHIDNINTIINSRLNLYRPTNSTYPSDGIDIWGNLLVAKGMKEKEGSKGYNVFSQGLIFGVDAGGRNTKTGEKAVIGVFCGANISHVIEIESAESNTHKLPIFLCGVYSSIDSSFITSEITCGLLKLDLGASDFSKNELQLNEYTNLYFYDLRVKRNTPISSSLEFIATVGIKYFSLNFENEDRDVDIKKYIYTTEKKTYHIMPKSLDLCWFVGASIVIKNFDLDDINFNATIDLFNQGRVLDNHSYYFQPKSYCFHTYMSPTIMETVVEKIDSNVFSAGISFDASYTNGSANFGFKYVNSKNYNGIVGNFNLKISF